MPDGLLNVKDFAARIKKEYPDYADVDDFELTERVVKKHPTYRSTIKLFNVPGGDRLIGVAPEMLRHWDSLQSEFEREGVTPEIRSGFRTAQQQNQLHRRGLPTKGNDGYINISPHQEGRALDIRFTDEQRERGRQVLARYARQHGLHIPSDEPWHITVPKRGGGLQARATRIQPFDEQITTSEPVQPLP